MHCPFLLNATNAPSSLEQQIVATHLTLRLQDKSNDFSAALTLALPSETETQNGGTITSTPVSLPCRGSEKEEMLKDPRKKAPRPGSLLRSVSQSGRQAGEQLVIRTYSSRTAMRAKGVFLGPSREIGWKLRAVSPAQGPFPIQ